MHTCLHWHSSSMTSAENRLQVNVAGPPVKHSVPAWKTGRQDRHFSQHILPKARSRIRLTNQVLLASRELLTLFQVSEKLPHIGVEALDRPGPRRWKEAEDLHLTIIPNPQFPCPSSNLDASSRLSDRV